METNEHPDTITRSLTDEELALAEHERVMALPDPPLFDPSKPALWILWKGVEQNSNEENFTKYENWLDEKTFVKYSTAYVWEGIVVRADAHAYQKIGLEAMGAINNNDGGNTNPGGEVGSLGASEN